MDRNNNHRKIITDFMKNIFLLSFFTFLFISFSFAQSETHSEIKIDTLTTKENLHWLEDFKKMENKAEKIQAIKDKIVFDSAYEPQIYNTGCSFATNRPKIDSSYWYSPKSQNKILFIVSSSKNSKKAISLLELRMFPNSTNEILSLLNKNTVSSMNAIEEITDISSSIFIILTIKDRKTKKKIKAIRKKQTQKKH